MTVEQLRQLEQAANREVSCDHRLDFHDFCDECHLVDKAKVSLMFVAPRVLPALLDIAEAAQGVLRDLSGPDVWVSFDSDAVVGLADALSRLDTEGGT